MKHVSSIAQLLAGLDCPIRAIYPGLEVPLPVEVSAGDDNKIKATPTRGEAKRPFQWVALLVDAQYLRLGADDRNAPKITCPIGPNVIDGTVVLMDDHYAVLTMENFLGISIPEEGTCAVIFPKAPLPLEEYLPREASTQAA